MLSGDYQDEGVSDLVQAYLNEKYSPELLLYNPIIDRFHEMIKVQQDLVPDIPDYFTSYCVQLELERIKYIIRLFLRERIMKMEQLITEDYKLSRLESLYLSKFKEIMPSKIAQEPQLEKGVFCRVLADIGQIYTQDNEIIRLQRDDIFLIRYSTIRKFVSEGSVILI